MIVYPFLFYPDVLSNALFLFWADSSNKIS